MTDAGLILINGGYPTLCPNHPAKRTLEQCPQYVKSTWGMTPSGCWGSPIELNVYGKLTFE